MRIDPVELSRELISFNTINPPGNELSCIQHLEEILTCAGLETSLQNFAPGRANLIARIGGAGHQITQTKHPIPGMISHSQFPGRNRHPRNPGRSCSRTMHLGATSVRSSSNAGRDWSARSPEVVSGSMMWSRVE